MKCFTKIFLLSALSSVQRVLCSDCLLSDCASGLSSDGESRGDVLLQQAYSIDTRTKLSDSNSSPAISHPPKNAAFVHANATTHSVISLHAGRIHFVSIGMCLFAAFCILCAALVWQCYASEQTESDKISREYFCRDENGKLYSYDNERLLTWQVLFTRMPSVATSWRVWVVVPCVLSTACAFAAMVEFNLNYAGVLDTEKIDKFGGYLRVFIAFMLGLFMNNAFQRWNSSVNNFRQFLTSIKQIMWTVRLMPVRKEIVDELERKLILACYILEAEMETDLGCKAAAWQSHWDITWKSLREEGLLAEDEIKFLNTEREAQLDIDMGTFSTAVWSWIGQTITKVKGEPGVLVPLYVRLIAGSQSCIANVDKLKTCVQVQVPFTYAYLLAMIVHLNNFMLAVCTGLQIGSSFMSMNAEAKDATSARLLYQSATVLMMQLTVLLIQPVMYQACLVIAHVLNHPFGDHVFHLPTKSFILMLRDELKVCSDSFKFHHHQHHDHKALKGNTEKEHSSGGSSSGGDGDDDGDDDADD